MVLDNTRVNKTIRGGGTTRRWFGQRIGVRYPWGWHQSGSFSARRRFGGLMDCVVMCLDRGVGGGIIRMGWTNGALYGPRRCM